MSEAETDTQSASTPRPRHPRTGFLRRAMLWTLAILLMAASVVYQRRTGPTYPMRGSFVVHGEEYRYRLIRSQETTEGGEVAVPVIASKGATSATLHYKRFKTADEFTSLPMKERPSAEDGAQMVTTLPVQPAAGKLEYYITLQVPDGDELRIPESPEDNVIIRYKDPVPGHILWPHILMMFFAVLIGMRAGLSALFDPRNMRLYAWIAFIGMSVGGMVLGPVVQKYAFGEYWTGFPWGGDWTDNKMLIMWLSWLVGCTTIGFSPPRARASAENGDAAEDPRPRDGIGRFVVVIASIVMMVVYLIPHSMRGSELDYSQVDRGVDPADAIETGRAPDEP